MAHGFGAARALRLYAYAAVFARAGYAVVVFDYRGWGDSDGVPRHVLNIADQQQPPRRLYRAATLTVAFVLLASVFSDLTSLEICLLAARAARISILDGVHLNLDDEAGFAEACRQGRELGFDGKTLIHPSQVDPCNTAFSPGEAEIADARKVIAAFDLPENRAKGAISLDGRMVERLHADIARQVVAMADAIAARAGWRDRVAVAPGGSGPGPRRSA